MSALSVWFKAELLLAAASIKADADQLKIEAELRKELDKLIVPTMNALIAQLEAMGTLPATPGLLQAMLTDIQPQVTAAIEESMVKAAVLEGVDLSGNKLFSIDDFSPTVRNMIRDKAFDASKRTMDALRGNITEALADAYASGLGIGPAADALRSVTADLKTFELERIARTEINSAQNTAAAQTIRDLGLRYHQWIATLDDRVRETHEAQHLMIAEIGALFPNGCEFPGDTNAEPEEFINCRCRIRPYIMPSGMRAPMGVETFFEEDLVTAL